MTSPRRIVALALASLAVLSACGNTAEPTPAAKTAGAPATTPTGAPAAAPRPGGAITWDAPASFTKVDHPSSMRKATYHAPKVGSDAEPPELAVTVVGGSIDANIDRWVGQFDPGAKDTLTRSTRKVGAYEVTLVEMRGTFQGGGPMMGGAAAGPKTGWALLAAIVPDGDMSWFFKMTGPEASVTAARADFDALVASFRPAG